MRKFFFLFSALLFLGLNGQTSGVLVLNEGGAGSTNAEVSLIDNQGNVTNNYFGNHNNNAILGDTAQDIKIYGDKIFIVLNISNTIKVINKNDFSLITTITSNLNNPRYIAFKDNNAYVTNWGASGATNNYVSIYDLSNYNYLNSITVGNGAEKIFYKDNRFYVLLKGGFGLNKYMDIINAQTNTVEQQVNVGDSPHSIFEKDNFLYIMSSGNPYTPTANGTFTIFDTTTQTTTSTLTFPSGSKPMYMDTDGAYIYYYMGTSIYKTPISSPSITTTAIAVTPITGWGGAYGFNVVNNKIYVADPSGYVAPGKILTYDLQGSLLNTLTVGPLPNQIIAYNVNSGNLGTSETKKVSTISIYPNPTLDKFFIKGIQNAKIKVMDMFGRIVIDTQYNKNGVNVNSLSKGTYLVNITEDNNKYIEKLIIK